MQFRRLFGVFLIIIGIIITLVTSATITGYIVSEEAVNFSAALYYGVTLLLCGTFLVVITKERKIVSRINEDSKLVSFAREATENQDVQREINHLIAELHKGNDDPGIGTRKLFGNVSYLRGRHGGRVFYRPIEEDEHIKGYEILGKASKSNEDRVISKLKKIYED